MALAVCPMCHVGNRTSSRDCRGCGYAFGQSVETLRGMLQAQRRRSMVAFIVLLTLDLAIIGGIVYCALALNRVVGLPGFAVVFPIWWTYRAASKISISRHSLKLIDAKEAQLPKATLLSK